MEFWGVELKHGEPLKVSPGEGMVLHLSQATVGEVKKDKGNEPIILFVNVDGKKFVLGTLFTEKLPQQQFDLIFDRDFEISHNWKHGLVYLYGYKASNPFEDDELPEGDFDDSDSEEDVPLPIANNGKPEPKSKQDKAVEAVKANVAASKKDSDGGKQKVKISEPKKDVNPEDDDDESSDDDVMPADDDDQEDDSEDSDDSDDSDDESDNSDEDDTPKKVEQNKKRPAESSIKTPFADKKAKATHPKSDGKKGEPHVATPHPAKQAGNKTPANKPNQQTPKSAGQHSCKSCNRTFGSDQALDSHTKAKHGSK